MDCYSRKSKEFGDRMTIIQFGEGEDGFDQILHFMRKQEEIANSSVTDDQKNIEGDCFVIRHYRIDSQHEIKIYGEVWSLDHVFEVEAKYYSSSDEMEEFEEFKESMRNSYERGYRFGKWYSELEVEGELGSAHISTMHKIDQEQFEIARQKAWID